ncbi:MAG: hypothetical protein GXP27_19575, partial [Planctomycetes bacterium]|nr:hypothetical protein [Planctomycetota bacterium]
MKARMRALVGLTVLAITGCYVYNPYWYPGGYGTPYGPSPGGQVPPGTAVPQGAYLTPQDFSLGNAQPLPSAN